MLANLTPTRAHGALAPSAWVQRWSHLVKPRGRVLDVACGYGRHAYYFYEREHHITLIDRAQDAIDSIAIAPAVCTKVVADIETGPWPLTGQAFDAVVVTNYLWRPLLPTLLESLAPGGVLIYETFAAGNETVGKPSRPDFLLQNGELLQVCLGLHVVGYEDGFEDGFVSGGAEATPRFVQRIAAVRKHWDGPSPARYPLAGTGG